MRVTNSKTTTPYLIRKVSSRVVVIFPRRDLNGLLRNCTRESISYGHFSKDRFHLKLDPDIPLIKGIIIPQNFNIGKTHSKSWWDTLLKHAIFSHLLQNAERAGATDFTIQTSHDEENVIIDIIDNGCGIAKEHEPHLFEEKATFGYRNGVRGHGLGLFETKLVIEMLGGTIKLFRNVPYNEDDNIRKSGVTWRITLPKNPHPANFNLS